MAKPIRPVAPPLALRSNPATFSARAESNITYQFDALPNWMDALADFTDDRADDALAAALAGDLPPITGKAGQFLRVKSDETGAEFISGANLSALAGVSTTGLLARTGAGVIVSVHQDTYPLRAGDTLTGGFTSTVDDDGTKSSGTYTPVVSEGNFKQIVNGGPFTLAAPTGNAYSIVVHVTNNASAGAITFSGFNRVDGDPYRTNGALRFFLYVTRVGDRTLLTVKEF